MTEEQRLRSKVHWSQSVNVSTDELLMDFIFKKNTEKLEKENGN